MSVSGRGRPIAPGARGKWQATNCSALTASCPKVPAGRSTGSSSAHTACAFGQRVRKRHPDGGLVGDGISPPSTTVSSGDRVGSGTGIADSSASV